MLVLLLVHGAPHRIKDMLTLRRLRGEVGPNWTVVSPHDRLVMLRAPLRRGWQRSLRGDGLEGNTSRFRVPRIADAPFGEVLLTQLTVFVQIDIQNLVVALLRGSLLRGVLPLAFFK